ncbi:hypothetical protein, partial [Crocosphaera sp. Alani8]|uniref:hypothetical protein n=1 Tax=Crocosphaera sp. Alani8 TaxID=3038952 RepID=UPI00313B2C94
MPSSLYSNEVKSTVIQRAISAESSEAVRGSNQTTSLHSPVTFSKVISEKAFPIGGVIPWT